MSDELCVILHQQGRLLNFLHTLLICDQTCIYQQSVEVQIYLTRALCLCGLEYHLIIHFLRL
jgi:hypothetical protein